MKSLSRTLAAALLGSISLAGFGADSNPRAVSDLLDRIGGTGTASRFVTVVDETLAPDGSEKFVITSAEGKPCVKGSTLSALTAGLGWYLNHYANINLTWNRPTADFSSLPLPVPAKEETHSTSAIYRYNFNYCTFSYSMSTWTWERWQQEIDWMALRGVNMPLQIVGLEEVWRKFLMDDYGYSQKEVNDYVAGPCFMAWFGMINLEGWGGPNPDWWYERQAQLGRQINERMRSLGIEPVLPGFCQLPSTFTKKTGVATVDQGNWCGFKRPFLAQPSDSRFSEVAAKFYARVHEVMGESRYYSIDPFHEGGAPSGIDAAKAYQKFYEAMNAASPGAQWVIQQWQWNSAQWKSLDNVPVGRLIVLDLYGDGNPGWGNYGNHDVVFSTIFNFGGRTGFFGRLNMMVDNYWQSRTKATVKGIGAAPEAIEQTPIAYDLLFELPWLDSKPDTQQWVADYVGRRYQADSPEARSAWELIRTSSLDCRTGKQGPHEAIVCGRPALQIDRVSSWGFADIFYDTNMTAAAVYRLLDASLEGQNYSFDLTDLARQALTDYSKSLLAGLKEANDDSDTELFGLRRDAFLQLILDLDELLNTNSEFMLGHWTERARKMADEVSGTTDADRDWLELDNARTLITTWGPEGPAGSLRDYSYREWGGIMKDFYYQRWKIWFNNGMKAPDGGWFKWEWNWAHSNPAAYPTEPTGDTREVASRLLPKYLSPFRSNIAGAETRYIPRLLATDLKGKLFDSAYRDTDYAPDFNISGAEIAEIAIDFNRNTTFGDDETVKGNAFRIPADAPIGERTVRLILTDGTRLTYTLRIIEEITEARTVSVRSADPAKGSVSIDGTKDLSVSNKEAVIMRATPALLFDFDHWEDSDGNNAGTDNPLTYYGKEAATFTAHFVENKWGVPQWNGTDTDRSDMAANNQFLTSLSVSQGGETAEIYSASELPDGHFISIPTRIKSAPGAEFTFNYKGDAVGLGYLFLSAYADLNHDGIFDPSTELIGTIGTRNAQDARVADGTFRMLLPFETLKGTTHIRLRFDSAWGAAYDATIGAFPADAPTNRLIYELILEVNDGVDYVTNVSVASNNNAYGTVRSENMANVYAPGEEVILTAFPNAGFRFLKWVDSHGRQLPAEWCKDFSAGFTAYDNARITAVFEPIPLEIDGWTFGWDLNTQGKIALQTILAEGDAELDLKKTNSLNLAIGSIAPGLFAGTGLTELTLPSGNLTGEREVLVSKTVRGNGQQQVTQMGKTVSGNEPFILQIAVKNNGKSFNQWGTPLYGNGTNALADDYSNGWSQVYLTKDGTIDVKWDSAKAVSFTQNRLEGDFTVTLASDGANSVEITVTPADGSSETQTLTNRSTMKDMSQFAAALPSGMNVTVKFLGDPVTVGPGEAVKGAKSLLNIHGSGEKDGIIYKGSNVTAFPEGRLHSLPFRIDLAGHPTLGADAPRDLALADAAGDDDGFASLWQLDLDANGSSAFRHLNSGLFASKNASSLQTTAQPIDYELVYGTKMPQIKFAGKTLRITPVKEFTVAAGARRAIAFPHAVIIPAEGCYRFAGLDDREARLTPIAEGYALDAGEAVIVRADAPLTFPLSLFAEPEGSVMGGTTAARDSDAEFYLLEGYEFVRHPAGVIPANSGFIPASSLPSDTPERFPAFPGESSIDEISSGTDSALPLYDLQGRRVISPSRPGIYITPSRIILKK